MEKKNISFIITVILSVLVILFCTKETVIGQSRADMSSQKLYYAPMEEEYVAQMRQMLANKGYSNSGITIRWVLEEEGTRVYTVMIYHKWIDRLDEKGKEALLQELEQTEFIDQYCSFCYEFLTI
ncbi:MAG: hypothetical protein K2P65_16120 [Lachnospiraceae bacterium]|nr:hypothetical protein [Lachnospiraceae bacterium]